MRRMFVQHVLAVVMSAAAVPAIAAPQQATTPPTQPPAAVKAATLDLNMATLAELEGLPGIGRATAQRILEHRQKIGGFKKIEELMNVKGIGEKSFLRLKPLVSVSAKTEKAGGSR